METPQIGGQLRRHRQAAGLTQEALAERAGLGVRTVRELERDAAKHPHPATLNQLADALQLTPTDRASLHQARHRHLVRQSAAAPPGARGAQAQVSVARLPPPFTSFVGRTQEMETVRALLHETRLLTLTGAGGCGKTRLALQVAGTLMPEYPDGICLVELATVGSPELVPDTLVTALSLREAPSRPVLETLRDYLAPRRLLLLLDNCEHLVAACAALAGALLQACPELRILATSREVLEVAGETLFRVPSLEVPNPWQVLTLDELHGYAAIRLFEERARARRTDFTVSQRNAAGVVQICHRLDGIPLAIELAAARCDSLSVEDIAAHLDDCFRLLTGGPRLALPRQQTLRATLDWSFGLLSAQEQLFLPRLSVFASGCTLAAAEAVGEGDGVAEPDVLDLLAGLVRKSLVQLDERDGGAARYRLLDTVRQYGRERLAMTGAASRVSDLHLTWCVDLAEEAAAALCGPAQGPWLARLELEHDNLRAALDWALRHGEGERAVQLAGSLARFWQIRGHLSEGRRRLTQSLEAGAGVAAALRARALHGAGTLAWLQGDYVEARTRYRESLALFRQLGDREGMGTTVVNLGQVAADQGDYPEARARCEEGLVLCRSLGDRQGTGIALLILGQLASLRDQHAEALARNEEGLALFRELGDKRGMGQALNNLGNVAWRQCEFTQARALYEQSLALRRELGDKQGMGQALNNLGNVACRQGDCDGARSRLEESLALYAELGHRRGMSYALVNLGDLALEQGDLRASQERYEQSLALRWELQDRRGIAACFEVLAELAAAVGEARRAAVLCGAAERLRDGIGAPKPPAERARYAQGREAASAAMGNEAFAAARAAGQAMPLEEAVACALHKHRHAP